MVLKQQKKAPWKIVCFLNATYLSIYYPRYYALQLNFDRKLYSIITSLIAYREVSLQMHMRLNTITGLQFKIRLTPKSKCVEIRQIICMVQMQKCIYYRYDICLCSLIRRVFCPWNVRIAMPLQFVCVN